jgi:predicted DNA binding CopG/RHH family protein
MKQASKQLRVFEEELEIIFSKATNEGVSVQMALSKIIKEWKEYDTVHQSRDKQ